MFVRVYGRFKLSFGNVGSEQTRQVLEQTILEAMEENLENSRDGYLLDLMYVNYMVTWKTYLH